MSTTAAVWALTLTTPGSAIVPLEYEEEKEEKKEEKRSRVKSRKKEEERYCPTDSSSDDEEEGEEDEDEGVIPACLLGYDPKAEIHTDDTAVGQLAASYYDGGLDGKYNNTVFPYGPRVGFTTSDTWDPFDVILSTNVKSPAFNTRSRIRDQHEETKEEEKKQPRRLRRLCDIIPETKEPVSLSSVPRPADPPPPPMATLADEPRVAPTTSMPPPPPRMPRISNRIQTADAAKSLIMLTTRPSLPPEFGTLCTSSSSSSSSSGSGSGLNRKRMREGKAADEPKTGVVNPTSSSPLQPLRRVVRPRPILEWSTHLLSSSPSASAPVPRKTGWSTFSSAEFVKKQRLMREAEEAAAAAKEAALCSGETAQQPRD